MAQDLKFELKTVKLPIHSAKHNSQSSGYHEADLRKDDDRSHFSSMAHAVAIDYILLR